MRTCNSWCCCFLPYCRGLFGIFSATGRGVIPHPRKQCQDYLIDLKFDRHNWWHKILRTQNFRKVAFCFQRYDVIKFFRFFNEGTIHCVPMLSPFMTKIRFSVLKLYSLHISAILTKRKIFMSLIFHVPSFEKMTVATNGGSILLKFCQTVAKR